MASISNSNHYCTLINVFTVAPEHQQELMDLLREATEQVISKFPGYVSANLHKSDDGKTITNYAQWQSMEQYQAMLKDETAHVHMKKAADLCIEFRPVTYTEIWSDSVA